MKKPDILPPWILFTDNDKPVAILAAGRPGEVADVRHLSLECAGEVVRCANALRDALVIANLESLQNTLQKMIDSFKLAAKDTDTQECNCGRATDHKEYFSTCPTHGAKCECFNNPTAKRMDRPLSGCPKHGNK